MEDIKPVKKITDWNSIRVRNKGQPENKWRDKLIKDLKKLNLGKWKPNSQR